MGNMRNINDYIFFSCNNALFSFSSAINIELEQAFWKKPNFTECELLEELPNNILDLHDIMIIEGKVPSVLQ